MSNSILVVDDEESIRGSLQGILEDEGYRVSLAVDGEDALSMLQKEIPDLVLLDIWMPRLDGLETLEKIKEQYPEIAVVMISGHGTIETAVKSTKLGAYDFIEKPLSLEKVLVTVHNAIGMSRLRSENESLRGMIEERYELVGDSEAVRLIREQTRIVAPTGASILISGENGTGKESLALGIHRLSSRRDMSFVTINCAALPEELLESELFGHEKGAFPGATTQRKGRLDLADGGTLFIEEIGEMPVNIQVKLQKFIEERKFVRMGGAKPVGADVRIMTSTSRPLEDAIKSGTFTDGLYYLLNVIPIDIPPLRERREDVPALIEHFLEIFCRRETRERKTIHPDAVKVMQSYDWPGNIRELKNIMERLVIMTPGQTIGIDQLPETMLEGSEVYSAQSGEGQTRETSSLREAREEFERDFIIRKLEECDWNVNLTAESIALERSNLQRKIRSYRIDIKK
jgi:two-component system, NtrC family, nitrogen regulation response regulator NtrX